MEVERPFLEQIEQVHEGLRATLRLRDWWNSNRTVIEAWTTKAIQMGVATPPSSAAVSPTEPSSEDWKIGQIIETANRRNPQYLGVIDDIVAGELVTNELVARHGSHDVVISALAHVTRAIHGIGSGSVPRLENGGWYARLGQFHQVHPAFRRAWLGIRGQTGISSALVNSGELRK